MWFSASSIGRQIAVPSTIAFSVILLTVNPLWALPLAFVVGALSAFAAPIAVLRDPQKVRENLLSPVGIGWFWTLAATMTWSSPREAVIALLLGMPLSGASQTGRPTSAAESASG